MGCSEAIGTQPRFRAAGDNQFQPIIAGETERCVDFVHPVRVDHQRHPALDDWN